MKIFRLAGIWLLGLVLSTHVFASDPPHSGYPGRNANVVGPPPAESVDPILDQGLRQQNEPSCAVNPENTSQICCGFNDYRGIDNPLLGDAWEGIACSRDGSGSWNSQLIDGHLADPETSLNLEFAADPNLVAAPGGLFFNYIAANRDQIGGLYLQRYAWRNKENGWPLEKAGGPILIAKGTSGRFIDKPHMFGFLDNSSATVTMEWESGTRTLPAGNLGVAAAVFVGNDKNDGTKILYWNSSDWGATWDHPTKLTESKGVNSGINLAADASGNRVCATWRRFNDTNETNSILGACSEDGGKRFSKAFVIEENMCPFDLSTLDGSATFGDGEGGEGEIAPVAFRSNAFPVIASNGTDFYVFWSDRGHALGSNGSGGCEALIDDGNGGLSYNQNGSLGRIVYNTIEKTGKNKWGPGFKHSAQAVDDDATRRGHQFMPAAYGANGEIVVAWLDSRDDVTQHGPRSEALDLLDNTFIWDFWQGDTAIYRHTLDVRSARISSDGNLSNGDSADTSSTKVSQYRRGIALSPSGNLALTDLEFNLPNARLFKTGTAPFVGDYVSVTAPLAAKDSSGEWKNSNAAIHPGSDTFHVSWADNRDVRGAAWGTNGMGTASPYSPANTTLANTALASDENATDLSAGVEDDPDTNPGTCSPGSFVDRTRDQNVYSAPVYPAVTLQAPGAIKLSTDTLQRAMPVMIQNRTADARWFRLVLNSSSGASFKQNEAHNSTDIKIWGKSSAVRTVFDASGNALPDIEVIAQDCGTTMPGSSTSCAEVNAITLNYDPLELGGNLEQPDYSSGSIYASELHDPNLLNPTLINPILLAVLADPDLRLELLATLGLNGLATTTEFEALVASGDLNDALLIIIIQNPDILNINLINPTLLNTMLANPTLLNPTLLNEGVENPTLLNPTLLNAALWDALANPTLLNVMASNPTLLNSLVENNVSTDSTEADLAVFLNAEEIAAVLANPTLLNPTLLNSLVANPTLLNTTLVNSAINNVVDNPTLLNAIVANPTLLNAVVSNPTLLNTLIDNGVDTNTTETELQTLGLSAEEISLVYDNPTLLNPTLLNPTLLNPTLLNPTLLNALVANPTLLNTMAENPTLLNPTLLNPTLLNTLVANPTLLNALVENPTLLNPTLLNPTLLNTLLTAGVDGSATQGELEALGIDPLTAAEVVANPTLLNPTLLNTLVANPTLLNTVVANPTLLNPTLLNETLANPTLLNPTLLNPTLLNPTLLNPTLLNPTLLNPTLLNPDLLNATLLNIVALNPTLLNGTLANLSVENPTLLNPTLLNPTLLNPTLLNPTLLNPTLLNPTLLNAPVLGEDSGTIAPAYSGIENPDATAAPLSEAELLEDQYYIDVTYQVRNDGNTTTGYLAQTYVAGPKVDQATASPLYTGSQLIVSKPYLRQTVRDCQQVVESVNNVVVNIIDPPLDNPPIANLESASPEAAEVGSFWLAPGEVANITLRLFSSSPDSLRSDLVGMYVNSEACNSEGNCASKPFAATTRVFDETPPELTGGPSGSIELDPANNSLGGQLWEYDEPTAYDEGDGEVITVECAEPSGTTFPVGTTSHSCTATDSAGNSAEQEFTVTVVDLDPPVFDADTVPDDTSLTATSLTQNTYTFAAPTATDVVDGIITASCDDPDYYALGTTAITCIATDGAGNEDSVSFNVSFADTTAPVFTTPVPTPPTGEDTNGSLSATVTYPLPAAIDDLAGTVAVVCTPPGDSFPVGTTEVTCTANDGNGNGSSQTFEVVVADKTPPVFDAGTVPTDTTIEASSPGANTFTFTMPTATDAYDDFSGQVTTVSCDNPGQYPLGVTTVACTATDGAGNSVIEYFDVSFVDTTPPAFTTELPTGVGGEDSDGTLSAVISFDLPEATDVVAGAVSVVCNPASASAFAIGSTEVTCTASDGNGNAATQVFSVVVADATAPIFEEGTVPGDSTIEANSLTSNSYTFTVPTATDAYDEFSGQSTTVSCDNPAQYPLGSTTVTCTATDAAGNEATTSFAVTFEDTTAPTLDNLPGSRTIEATSTAGATTTWATVTASDAVYQNLSVSCDALSGATFGLGTSAVNCSVTDGAGNTVSGSFSVTVVDTTAPALGLSADITVEAVSAAGTAVSYPEPSASDSASSSVSVSCTVASGATFPIGTTTVSCTATDAQELTTTGSFDVTVQDTTAPILSGLPQSITEEAGAPEGNIVQWAAPTVSDAVNGSLIANCAPASGSTFAVDSPTTVLCNVSDAAGNAAQTGSFTVTVQDTIDPVLALPANISVPAEDSSGANVEFSVTATDLASASVDISCDGTSGDHYPIGTTTVSCTATDAQGRTTTGSFSISVSVGIVWITPIEDTVYANIGPNLNLRWGYGSTNDLLNSRDLLAKGSGKSTQPIEIVYLGEVVGESCGADVPVLVDIDAGKSSLRYKSGEWQLNWQTGQSELEQNGQSGDLVAGCYQVNIPRISGQTDSKTVILN